MPRKSSRGRRPQSRRGSGGSLITWLLILLLIAVIALIALPHFQQTTPSAETAMPTRTSEDKPLSGEAGDNADTGRSQPLPTDNRVLERPGNAAPAQPSAGEDQEANEVAAMVSQGVVKYDRATRNQQGNAATTPPAREAPPR